MSASILAALNGKPQGNQFDTIWENFLEIHGDYIGGMITQRVNLSLNQNDILDSFGILAIQLKGLKKITLNSRVPAFVGSRGGGLFIPSQNMIKVDNHLVWLKLDPSNEGGIKYIAYDFCHETLNEKEYNRVLKIPVIIDNSLLRSVAHKCGDLTVLALVTQKKDPLGSICTDPKFPQFLKVYYNLNYHKVTVYSEDCVIPGITEDIVINDEGLPSVQTTQVVKTSETKARKFKSLVINKWIHSLPNDWETLDNESRTSLVEEFISSLDGNLQKAVTPLLKEKFVLWTRDKLSIPSSSSPSPSSVAPPLELANGDLSTPPTSSEFDIDSIL